MSKITREEIEKRIDETERVLLEQLHLKENFSAEELSDFYVKFIPYLMHDRNNKMLGRTPETLKNNIDKYIEFCTNIGMCELDIITSIKNFPSIIHTFDDDFVDKFVIMSVAENETNNLRKEKLINNPRAFTIDIETIFARYSLMMKLNYPITWNNLVKATNVEFAKIFVKDKYDKPYKIFESIDDLSVDNLKRMFPLDFTIISALRSEEKNLFLFGDSGLGSK